MPKPCMPSFGPRLSAFSTSSSSAPCSASCPIELYGSRPARNVGSEVAGAGAGLGIGLGREFAEEVVEVEGAGEHREIPGRGTRPGLAWAVPIKLDAVVVGIAQIEGFADAVIGGAVEGDARGQHAAQRIRQLRAGGVEDGQMVEACRARCRRPATIALPGVERDVVMVITGRKKGRAVGHALRDGEA